jgi:hypothetical protein
MTQFGSSVWAGDVSKLEESVFFIQSLKDSRAVNCTATLLNVDGSCHLVSNEHCTLDGEGRTNLYLGSSFCRMEEYWESYWALAAGNCQAVPLTIKKVDIAKDLVAFYLPRQLDEECQQSPVLTNEWVFKDDSTHQSPNRDFEAVAALGFVNGIYQESFTGRKNWLAHSLFSSAPIKRYYLAPDFYLYLALEVGIVPGMSGGISITNRGKVLGLTARFVPFQERSFIVPINDVLNFLKTPQVELSASTIMSSNLHGLAAGHFSTFDRSNTQRLGGENSSVMGGENSSVMGGENSSVMGGENSSVMGGENSSLQVRGYRPPFFLKGEARFSQDFPVRLFREPDEGIVLPENASEVLLGVVLKRPGRKLIGEQIDGFDDFENKAKSTPELIKEAITRARRGLPKISVRRNLLERLRGVHQFVFEKVGLRDLQHLVYCWMPEKTQKWELCQQGTAMPVVDLNPSKMTITLYDFGHRLRNFGQVPIGRRPLFRHVPRRKTVWKIEPSQDWSVIKLVSESSVLVCQNRHYLKLICSNNFEEFSLSITDTAAGDVSYRHTRQLQDPRGVNYINYEFGYLRSTKETRRKRREMQAHFLQ